MDLSIIVPCYNVEMYINRCIQSFQNNSGISFEIIAINDGSTDNTLKELYTLSEKYHNLKVIDIENQGVSNARNIGIEMASGEYILFVDSDDWIAENCLSKMYSKCTQESLDVLMFGFKECLPSRVEKEIPVFERDETITQYEAIQALLIGNSIPAIWNKMIKRSILINNNIRFSRDIKMGEDLLFSLKILINSHKIYQTSQSYYHYFLHDDSVTKDINDSVMTIQKAMRLIHQELNTYKMLEIFRDEIEFLQFKHLYYYRVIVGNIVQPYHKYFYESFDLTMYNKNSYYTTFEERAPMNIKLRILMYKYLPYQMSVFIHKIMKKIS